MSWYNEAMRELWRADVPLTETHEQTKARMIARFPFLEGIL